jgi:hypothetical protein
MSFCLNKHKLNQILSAITRIISSTFYLDWLLKLKFAVLVTGRPFFHDENKHYNESIF